MEIIKFRAWDKRKGDMINNAIELIGVQELVRCGLDLTNPFNYFDGLFWMQYSGIKDKNDVELYEHDIVYVIEPTNLFEIKFGKIVREVISYNGETTFKLEFNSFYFESLLDNKQYLSITENQFGQHDLESTVLVGNRFENPEL